LGSQISGEGATQTSDRILQIWVTTEHVAKFGDVGQATSEIRRQKKKKKRKKEKDLNYYSGKTEWSSASWRA